MAPENQELNFEGIERQPPGPPRDFAEGIERERDAEETPPHTRAA